MKKIILFFLFTIVALTAYSQGKFQWETIKLTQPKCSKFVYQTSKGIVFVKTDSSIVLTADEGKTWKKVTIPSLLFNIDDFIYDINVKEDENGNLYYLENSKVYKLEWSSGIFKQFNTNQLLLNGSFEKLAIKGDKMYIATSDNFYIYKFDTAGTFTKVFSKDWFVHGAEFHLGVTNNNFVKTSLGAADFFDSFNDDGSGFTSVTLPSNFSIEHSGVNSKGRFYTTGGKLFQYTDDKGVTWKTINNVIAQPGSFIYYDYFAINSADEMIVSVGEKFYFSKDDAKNWKEIPIPSELEFQNLGVNISVPNKISIYRADCHSNALYYSTDEGKTWKNHSLKINQPKVEGKFIVTYQGDIISSSSCGYFDRVKLASSNIEYEFPVAFTSKIYNIIPLSSGKWFAQAFDGYYTSIDKGKTWQIYNKIPFGIWSEYVSITQNGDLIMIDFDEYYLSTDEGETWQQKSAPNIFDTFFSDFIGQIYLYDDVIIDGTTELFWDAQYYDIAKKKTTTFEIPFFPGIKNYMKLLSDRKMCFISGFASDPSNSNKIYISKNFGKTFDSKPLPIKPNSNILGFDTDESGRCIVVTRKEAFVSYDEGDNWESIIANIPTNVEFISFAKGEDNRVYISANNGNIYKSQKLPSLRNYIHGNVFEDKNDNCIKDSNEKVLKNITVTSEKNYVSTRYSNTNGEYSVKVDEGTYKLKPKFNNSLYQACQDNYSVIVDGKKDSVRLDIPLKVLKYCADLKLSLGSKLPPRRCFSNYMYGNVCNEGTKDATNTKITIQLDSFYIFENASLPVISLVNKTLVLDAGTIAQGDCKSFNIQFKVDCNAKIGQEHCISYNVSSPDDCSSDQPGTGAKPALDCQKNVGSYDPNDKSAFVDGKKDAPQVKTGQKLEYLIRFQNTGTDTAFNIVVKDQISNNLDVASIEMGASSHKYTWEVRENVLFVTFKNIMLPDSFKSEKNSHGFFKFLVRPKANITNKDLISNTAAIFFDFNEPIFTNEVLLNKKTSKNYDYVSQLDFSLFPNPATEQITLLLPEKLDGEKEILLYNVESQLLIKQKTFEETSQIDINSLPKGIYFIYVKNKNQFGVRKFVKE